MTGTRQSNRLTYKTHLAKAVQLIASDKTRDVTKKHAHWLFRLNDEAARLLLSLVGQDANSGFALLRQMDNMNLYGSQIPVIFKEYFKGDKEAFVSSVLSGNEKMIRWFDKRKES